MNIGEQGYFDKNNRPIEKGEELELGTITNYKAAIRYYIQKEAQFAKYGITKTKALVKNDVQKFKNQFSHLMTDDISKKWNNLRQRIEGAINIDKNSGQAGKYSIDTEGEKIIRETIELDEEQQNQIINGASRGNNIFSILGGIYEKYLVPTLTKKGNQIIQEQKEDALKFALGNLITQIQPTGAQISASAKRTTGAIRPDIGINLIGEKENSVLFGEKMDNNKQPPLPVELQCDVHLDYNPLENDSQWNEKKLLKKYLKSQMFGFQVKSWKGKTFNKQPFTQMATLRKRLNNIFDNKYTSLKYAGQIMHYEVSREIFDIVGIVNVGVITGENFIWISNLLSEYIFSMHLVKIKENNAVNNLSQVRIQNNDVILRRVIELLQSRSLFDTPTEKKEIDLAESGKMTTVVPITFHIATLRSRRKS